MHIFHKYGKWEAVLIDETSEYYSGKITVSGQRRWCEVCNKMQVKRVT